MCMGVIKLNEYFEDEFVAGYRGYCKTCNPPVKYESKRLKSEYEYR